MSGINNIQAEGQIYDILAPEIVNDYVEKLGKTCINPNGYTKGSLILATDGSNVQRLYKTTSNISSNQVISEGGNVELKKLEDLFDDLEDALNSEIDDIDTELGNVKNALTNEVSARSQLGAHNLYVVDWGVTRTDKGITWTINTDGTIDVSGAINTSDTSAYIQTTLTLPTGSYKFSGAASGGGNNKWMIMVMTVSAELGRDYGDGIEFTLNEDTLIYVRLYVYKSYGTYSGLKFSPMARLASDADSTYQPPAMTNQQLTENSIRVFNITATTSASGNIAINNSDLRGNIPIMAYITGSVSSQGLYICSIIRYSGGFYVNVKDTSGNVLANTQVDLVIVAYRNGN